MSDDSRISAIARWDFKQARQSRLVWGTFILLGFLVIPGFWSTATDTVRKSVPPAIQIVENILSYLSIYLEITVLAFAYAAVATERESGAIRLLLGLPGTRQDVLVGKLLSRSLILGFVLGSLLTVLGVTIVIQQGRLPVVAFTVISGWVLLCGLCWLVFTVGLSAAFGSRSRALAAIAGTYVGFNFHSPIWDHVLCPILSGFLPVRYVYALNPTMTLSVVGGWLLASVSPTTSDVLFGPAAVSFLTLVVFAIVGFLIGYRRFEGADLG